MKRKNLMVLMAVSLVIALLVGCGTATNEETDSQTVTQSEADAPITETQEIESADVSEEIDTEEESEVVEETTPEQAEEPEVTIEPTETVEPEPQYTYTDLSQTMYAKQSVNVRSLPSTDGEKLGGLSNAQEVAVTGQCNETSWYRIDYNGSVGYVSNNYLVNEKPAEQIKPENNGGSSDSETVDNSYPLYTIIDEGGNKVYFYFLSDGTAMKPEEYWTCFNECIYMIMDRNGWDRSLLYNGVGTAANAEETGTYIDGKEVVKAMPIAFTD